MIVSNKTNKCKSHCNLPVPKYNPFSMSIGWLSLQLNILEALLMYNDVETTKKKERKKCTLWINNAWTRKRKGELPMASVENENIIEISDVDPIIRRSINIYSVLSFPPILIRRCWLFWLPPLFNQLWASKVAFFSWNIKSN